MEPARPFEDQSPPDSAAEDLGAVGASAGPGRAVDDGVPSERRSLPLARAASLRRTSMAVLVRARREFLYLARSPVWWAGLALSAVAAAAAVHWPLRTALLAGAEYTEPWRAPDSVVAEVLPVLAFWALPLALCPWALLAGLAGRLRPTHAVGRAALGRILGRGLLVGAAAAAVNGLAGAILGAHAPLVAASASSGAWTAALLSAVGTGVRAAVVHRAWAWPVGTVAVLWLGAGNVAAMVWLLPLTEGSVPRYLAVNVEREDGRIVSYECIDFDLDPYTGQRPEMVVWLAAANPALVAIAATGDALPPGSMVAWAADAYQAAATGPSAWEPCLEGYSADPAAAALDVLGHAQLVAVAGALVGAGSLRGRARRTAQPAAPGRPTSSG
ncbi:hypothetical protein [Sinomonas halotolerans]|uniref:ABC transporter permease n=1 Tax=Sinomonas halotolerans TaxID=1644133 RepID=A0ABU9WXT7_9MICC